ncbi:MAG: hypothetical protein ABW123_04585 [Cystobacter sp.]
MTTPPDARYRPFRAASYGLYIAVVVAFCLGVIFSVTRSVRAMSPTHLAPVEPLLTYRECLDAAQTLWSELESAREKLVRASPAHTVDSEWMTFRTSWLGRLRERESHCALDSRNNAELKQVYRRLEDVLDHYTVHAVQYAGEVGTAVNALQGAFSTARKSPAAGRLP